MARLNSKIKEKEKKKEKKKKKRLLSSRPRCGGHTCPLGISLGEHQHLHRALIMSASQTIRIEDYTIGWVCALFTELAAAQDMLDERHSDAYGNGLDTNTYTLGSIGALKVVIACLPDGQMGVGSAAAVAAQMKSTFPSIQFGLMVGVGGGVPTAENDMRLGDVVVSRPGKGHGGVVQYDLGKNTPSGFRRTGFLNSPPQILLTAIAKVRSNHLRGENRVLEYASKSKVKMENPGHDILFEAGSGHIEGSQCEQCDKDKVVRRKPRAKQEIVIHYGTIASGSQVMRDAVERDRLSSELGGVLCFEMEAAGLMNIFPCLVIRGICDYADSHKNKAWQQYAARMAAAYAKDLLSSIPTAEVKRPPPITNNKTVLEMRHINEREVLTFSGSFSSTPRSWCLPIRKHNNPSILRMVGRICNDRHTNCRQSHANVGKGRR
jgi:nucleoside phosphorylase